jgi:Tfp pilus assembly protein PilX
MGKDSSALAFKLKHPTRKQRAVALVIILAFIVLLTGLVVAFFSRSLSERQISNSSAGQVKAALFADGVAESLIGKLKQEIALSSTVVSIPCGTGTTNLYFPLSGTAGVMLPQRSGTGANPTITSWSPNLLIRSGSGTANQYFFVASSGSTIRSGAIAVSSTTPSLNGRYISLTRWNKHYLLTGTGTNMTPIASGSNAFAAPDWVLVARSGSNPVQTTLASPTKLTWSGTSPSTVVGRYAFAIYHEGGLLDVNAAGYPIGSGSSAVIAPGSYKPSLAYADLTQIGLSGTLNDKLVAWRDWASAMPTSGTSYSDPGFTAQSGSTYFNSVVGNRTGFLTASGTALNNNQSDRMFASRQEFISFARDGLGLSGTALNVLNYLATFTRDINQPSYIRVQSVNSKAPGYNQYAPKVLAANAGGNNMTGLDDQINPSFLSVRVTQAFTRNDGSPAQIGEPLVKKRFALNRLAWLTCKGPSEPRATSSDADIQALRDAGFTDEWLKQGTDDGTDKTNIPKYFGLTWDKTKHCWNYIHGRNGTTGPILRLNSPADSLDVVRKARDADFFELLKAGINVGSIAKPGSSVPQSGKNIPSAYDQYYIDQSVDNAIIQIGADIIDQFDSDNFPTQIVFNDGSNPATTICGIENLPYLNRVHPAVVKTQPPQVASDPKTDGTNALYYGTGDSLAAKDKVMNTGLGAVILIPEIWNPHDWCGDNASKKLMTQTVGTMGPQNFEIYADTDGSVMVEAAAYSGETKNFNAGQTSLSPGFPSFQGKPISIDRSNSYMTFDITPDQKGAQLFREPTVLYIPQKPTNSNLSAPGLSGGSLVAKIGDGGPFNAGAPQFPGPPIYKTGYIGMFLGNIPLIWRSTGDANTPDTVWRANTVVIGDNPDAASTSLQSDPGVKFTFNLRCKDAFDNFFTYDKKEITIGHKGIGFGRIARPMHAPWAGLLQPCRDGDRQYAFLDPRTSRFGYQYTSPENGDLDTNSQLKWSFPPFSYSHLVLNRSSTNPSTPVAPVDGAWLSRSEGIMGSVRNGWGSGCAVQVVDDKQSFHGLNPYNFPKTYGFYPGNTGSGNGSVWWSWKDAGYGCRFGLFAENDGAPVFNNQITGDVQFYAGLAAADYSVGQYYQDPDGVVRRGMGGWSDARYEFIGPAGPLSAWTGAFGSTASGKASYAALTGLPMRVAHQVGQDNMLHKSDLFLNYPPTVPTAAKPLMQADARPMILNRPFRSVGELGYTFSGTPWKNLNFDMPESGDSALLDVFCIADTVDPSGLVAGKVNLNTLQVPVVKAIIAGAYKNEWGMSGAAALTEAVTSDTLADTQAKRLVARTSGVVPAGVVVSGAGTRPLQNISELVGKWVSGMTLPKAANQYPGGTLIPPAAASNPPYGPASYDGYSADLINPLYFLNWAAETPVPETGGDPDDPANPNAVGLDKAISRRRAAPIRALASAGQTRVWNLLIDMVAQTGRYPTNATKLDQFLVEGEQRYWVHVAIDRLTGEVLDKQIEIVKE